MKKTRNMLAMLICMVIFVSGCGHHASKNETSKGNPSFSYSMNFYQDEFEEKYNSLSRNDMSLVAEAIDGMEDEYMSDDDYEEDGECLSVDDAAEIWLSSGMDEDQTFGYTEEELRNALK